MSRILVPIRYSAWLCGELGKQITEFLQHRIKDLPEVEVTRLPRAFLVSSKECDGVMLERVRDAVQDIEIDVAHRYPVFHHEMGPVWTGTLQAVFPQTPPLPAKEKVPVPA